MATRLSGHALGARGAGGSEIAVKSTSFFQASRMPARAGAACIRQSHASVYAAMLSAPLRLFIKQATSACMQAHNVFARSTPQRLASFSANMQLPARLPWALTAHMAGAHYSHHARCPVPARMTC